MIHRILNGIKVDDDTLAFDVIQAVGPRGHYLMEGHTEQHVDELFYPRLSERCNFDIWEQKDRPNMLKRAKILVVDILRQNKENLLDKNILEATQKVFPGILSCRRQTSNIKN
jgi:trimethylamine--corrinoid protein Co-methyltransferase